MGVLSAAAVGAIALALLANLTSAPEPEETDTTIPSLSQPTTTAVFTPQGDPIKWSSVYHMESPPPLAFIQRSGTMFLFANVDYDDDGFGLGLVVFSSADGHTWHRVGVGLEDRRVGTVIGTGFGFLALGGDPGRGYARVWTSTDGVTWDDTGLPELEGAWYNQAAANADVAVVVGFDNNALTSDPVWDTISQRLQERLGDWGPINHTYYPLGVDRWQITVHAPLGIPVVSYSSEELGLTPDDFTYPPSAPQHVLTWATSDGKTWTRGAEFEGHSVHGLTTGPDRELRMITFDRDWSRPYTWVTTNGLEWDQLPDTPQLTEVQTWSGGWLGTSWNRLDMLYLSSDGHQWDELSVRELVQGRPGWSIETVISGESGMAMIYGDSSTGARWIPPEPIEVEKEGYRVTVTDPFLSVLDPEDDSVILRVSRWSNDVSEGVEVNWEDLSLRLNDPSTDQLLVEFGFDELTELETQTYGTYTYSEAPRVFLYTSNGEDWTIQPFPHLGGEDGWVQRATLFGDVVLAVVPSEDWTSFEIWAAKLPTDGP